MYLFTMLNLLQINYKKLTARNSTKILRNRTPCGISRKKNDSQALLRQMAAAKNKRRFSIDAVRPTHIGTV